MHYAAIVADQLNFEMKQLAWALLGTACESATARSVVIDAGFFDVLLMFIDVEREQSASVTRWGSDQRGTLRSLALRQVSKLALLAPEAYVEAEGPRIMLDFLSAGRGREHTEAVLRHLHSAAAGSRELCDALGAAGLVEGVLAVAQDGGQPEPLRQFALMTLTALCDGHEPHMRRYRKAGGVEAAIGLLRLCRQMDQTLPAPFVLAALHLVWTAIAPDRKATALFLVQDGLDELLSLIEGGNKHYRPTTLSLLVDLLANKRAHDFFFEWRSSANAQTALHLLTGIWTEEDGLRTLTHSGVVSNATRPLAGLNQRTDFVTREAVLYGTMTLRHRDELDSVARHYDGDALLSKVWAAIATLGFDVCGAAAAPEERPALEFMQQYVAFRQGEIWADLQREFAVTGLAPTEEDAIRIVSGIKQSEAIATNLQQKQAAIVAAQLGTRKAAEAGFYADLLTQAKLDEDAKYYKKDRSRLTMRERQAAKERHDQMLRDSIRPAALWPVAAAAERSQPELLAA
jgi:hypothetical protein